jgi:SNF2 family DNA or RNA helicase
VNKVGELAPCIEFLRIKPYSNPATFKETFGGIDGDKKGRYRSNDAMRRLQVLLKAIMLRRTKNSKIDGRPIIQLLPKTEVIDHVVFEQDENLFYRDLEREGRVMVSKYLRGDATGKQYTQILLRLLRLRQACCHPYLHAEDLEWVEAENPEDDRMSVIAKSLSDNVVTRINNAEADGFQCPICFENISNPKIIVPCGHHICSECLVRLTHTTAEDNQQQGVERSSRGPCPSCRQVVELNDTITYYIYQRVHRPERKDAEQVADNSDDDDDDDHETGSEEDGAASEEEDDDEVDNHGNLKNFVVLDDDDDEDYRPEARQKIKVAKAPKKPKNKRVATDTSFHKLARLRKESRKNQDARRRYLRYLRETWRDSAKVTKCKEILAEIQKTGEKTIVFSQWTMLLDFLEVPVKYDLKLGYRRYDGSMSSTQRDNAVRDFMENPDVKVMLVSIKAGNAGLNLVCASQVVIMDPFWNPYVEMQGVDRAHRIGQMKPVTVHRLLVKETVEDRIAELQEQKRAVIDTALDENASMKISKLSAREVGFLFGLT